MSLASMAHVVANKWTSEDLLSLPRLPRNSAILPMYRAVLVCSRSPAMPRRAWSSFAKATWDQPPGPCAVPSTALPGTGKWPGLRSWALLTLEGTLIWGPAISWIPAPGCRLCQSKRVTPLSDAPVSGQATSQGTPDGRA
ncbi:uncharacterized protein B0I36DRAFT_356365 [Microdochium trichocladiopsis]|uniref:Uncharacterized protein n=1 Tax=Microdochium trichocladiopsis TaxID=1682393 RepID=A0A9P8XTV0_9PEZI|nr:uncharacterized protein B0I36DRAFT_356365 [Microdochium trichocladiopsis]KAH7012298.1 hypothetical protein B0I36DRAFT_356365 [Microdochium trichocladiopsis]